MFGTTIDGLIDKIIIISNAFWIDHYLNFRLRLTQRWRINVHMLLSLPSVEDLSEGKNRDNENPKQKRLYEDINDIKL